MKERREVGVSHMVRRGREAFERGTGGARQVGERS